MRERPAIGWYGVAFGLMVFEHEGGKGTLKKKKINNVYKIRHSFVSEPKFQDGPVFFWCVHSDIEKTNGQTDGWTEVNQNQRRFSKGVAGQFVSCPVGGMCAYDKIISDEVDEIRPFEL